MTERGWDVVSCDVPEDRADELCGALAAGALGASVEPAGPGRVRVAIYPDPASGGAIGAFVEQVRAVLRVSGIDPEAASVTRGRVADGRWVERFHASLRPRPLGTRFEVRAPGDGAAASGRRVLWLVPGRAFGTGEHPTTCLAAAALERWVRPGAAWLDLGCGTGVLALVARALGAVPVRAVDVDPEAVAVAREVLAANPGTGPVELGTGSLAAAADRRWDGIVANIETSFFTAPGAATALARALVPGGCLVVSGFLAADADEVAAALAAAGLATVERVRDGEWGASVARSGVR